MLGYLILSAFLQSGPSGNVWGYNTTRSYSERKYDQPIMKWSKKTKILAYLKKF